MKTPPSAPSPTFTEGEGANSAPHLHPGFNLFRRPPRQSRSREMTERILQATIAHLEQEGGRTLNTNRIAERAGVDIASLYRYFGSKEAILLELAERWIASIQAIHAHYLQRTRAGMPLLAMLQGVLADMAALPEGRWGYGELARLMDTLPPLQTLETAHAEYIAQFWADTLRHHGSPWPTDRLLTFARLLYVQGDAALSLASRRPPAEAAWVRRWQRRANAQLLRQALPKRRQRAPGAA